MTLWEELEARELFYQCTNEDALKKLLETEQVAVYLGVDPTGESLHIGHLIPLIALCHFARYGHKPIVLVGGGTARVGDPSGKTEARPILSEEQLASNIQKIEQQMRTVMAKFDIDIIFDNNANWLNNLQYIDFIRDIGRHFSVSRMLSFDTYKNRLETGLSFLEFNYQLLQSYDYLHLSKRHNCKLQIGGADQWGNIVAGCDLIRRVEQAESYGYTLPLITRSDGSKMGKSEQGAIYLDPNITLPYDFYQYLRNTSDTDIIKFLKQYTFLSLDEIAKYEKYRGEELNAAKELFAYTLTEFIHGEVVAKEVKAAAEAAFYGTGDRNNLPSYNLALLSLGEQHIVDLYVNTALCSSKAEARRLIEQGGAKINNNKITSIDYKCFKEDFSNNEAILSAGKKKHIRIVLIE